MHNPESLEELCYKQIACFIQNAPPLYQEMIIGETSDRIKKNLIKEIYEHLPDIIPEIIQDLVSRSIKQDYIGRDFRTELSHLPKEMVECAIKTATETVNVIETKWLHCVLNQELDLSTPTDSDYDIDTDDTFL
jgi:hypothetical protein